MLPSETWRCKHCNSGEHYKTKDGPRCAPCGRARSREWRKTTPEETQRLIRRRATIKNRYGLSTADYEAMYETQNGRCWFCDRPDRKHLNVDHDHVTGQVRGLLCTPCNTGLGWFERYAERVDAYRGREFTNAKS